MQLVAIAKPQFDVEISLAYATSDNITGKPVIWMESPPGVVEGQSPSLRTMQEYGANWVFGCRGQF